MNMHLEFSKYHGTGNDFIIVDGRTNDIHLDQALIAKLCHRRFGIGADGLIIIRPSDQADFKMEYYNSDGNESTMCGNGGRCAIAYAVAQHISAKNPSMEGIDGIHHSAVDESGIVSLKMSDVADIQKTGDWHFLNTGSPHVVVVVDDVMSVDVFSSGKKIRNDLQFAPGGTNVNFIHLANNLLDVRTYERGVEDETLSCGTGVTAAAIVTHYMGMIPGDQHQLAINTPGGRLKVLFHPKWTGEHITGYHDIWLVGPAVHVFDGVVELP